MPICENTLKDPIPKQKSSKLEGTCVEFPVG